MRIPAPKLRELCEALKVLFVEGPATEMFPARPPRIYERFRGWVEPRAEGCIGCGACAEVCPAQAIKVTDDPQKKIRKLVLDRGQCIFCGRCVEFCTTQKGLVQTRNYDTATFNRQDALVPWEKDLVVCEMDGAVIAPADQIKWVFEKIHELGFSNPTLVIQSLKDLGLAVGPSARGGSRPAERSDVFRVLCPKCRREVLLRESWG